ncbi:MAG TPA: alpha-amylase family glycosyl hydrolase [Kofleriaceae bacterium]|nr:alpha-amylase family glycosyl hydrolase [Kofleriaceae bacterium]
MASPAPVRAPGSFADNPIVYFVMTDRFENGDPSNDHSYGRAREAAPRDDIATFHGGDLRGLTAKVTSGWFDRLGVNALWITAPYEQIHGWVVGGNNAFKHYAYHGYYALDYTLLDQNMGTPQDLRALVDAAHARGIRVLFDVVMNHPGYLDIETAHQLGVKVLWPGFEKATPADYHQYIDYNNFNFGDWWGRAWVRAGLPGYIDGGRDDLTSQLAYLPDFRTESKEAVTLPVFLKRKPGTRAVDLPGTTVRGYLIRWLTDWVREYGIDGFRCDTVKHVEPEAWHELKVAATAALAAWKAQHPEGKIDDAPFWMVGEFWGHGPARGPLHDAGFDAMINFEFQSRAAPAAAGKLAALDPVFAEYAGMQHGKPAQMLSYLSSHDTELFDRAHLIEGGSALLLAPGGVQIYYGDETARPPGPATPGDVQQATRSDMNWDHVDDAVLAHWRALGSFRARHVALAHGVHARLQAAPYVFSRVDGDDRVVVALDVPAGARLLVGPVFAEGEAVRDAYAGVDLVVHGGAITVARAARAVLLERVR